jgi:hypothetical protein
VRQKGSEDCGSAGQYIRPQANIQVYRLFHAGGIDMGGTGKKAVEGKASSDGAKKRPPKRVEDDDEEDGDFATPKRDRSGEDDQPL